MFLLYLAGGSCSRCAELEEQLHFVTSDRDSIREKKQNLDKEILEMSKRIEGMSEAHNQEIRTVLKDVQIARKNLSHQSERVVEESKQQVQAIKDLQLENGKLKEMINEKKTEIRVITELLATGKAALKNISEQLGETKQNLQCEKETVKEDTGKLVAVSNEENLRNLWSKVIGYKVNMRIKIRTRK